jgi:uncharacterized protein DUF2550
VLFDILDGAGAVVLLLIVGVLAFLVRLAMLRRGGASIACAFRYTDARPGRGWHFGVVRYMPAHLQWYRMFSLAPNAKHTFTRRGFEITGRRKPRGFELHAIPHTAVVVQCVATTRDGQPVAFELAAGATTMTGFLAWLESVPPGAHQHPDARRI